MISLEIDWVKVRVAVLLVFVSIFIAWTIVGLVMATSLSTSWFEFWRYFLIANGIVTVVYFVCAIRMHFEWKSRDWQLFFSAAILTAFTGLVELMIYAGLSILKVWALIGSVALLIWWGYTVRYTIVHHKEGVSALFYLISVGILAVIFLYCSITIPF